MMNLLIITIKIIFLYFLFNFLWKYRVVLKQKIINLGEKHIFLKFLVNLYFNNSLFVITTTLILSTYLLLLIFLHTNIIYESYNIISDFSVKKYQQDINFINDEFFNKERENFNVFIERSEQRINYRDKRLSSTENSFTLFFNFLKNLEMLKLIWIKINELCSIISINYWELLMRGYFKYWKIFWEWLDKSWPRRIKERDGMSSSEWYNYLIGRFITGLYEPDDQINYVAQMKELNRLRKLAEERRKIVDSSYDYWQYIENHPEFFRHFLYILNSSKKKYRGFLVKERIDFLFEKRLKNLIKFFEMQKEPKIYIESLDKHAFLYKRNFFYRYVFNFLVKAELDHIEKIKNFDKTCEIQSSRLLWILKRMAINEDLIKSGQIENKTNNEGSWYSKMKYFLFKDQDISNISNLIVSKVLKDEEENDENLKKSKSLLKEKIYQEIIYFWTCKTNKKYHETVLFEINFVYCFLKSKMGLRDFFFKDIDWRWYISLVIYLLIGWM